MIGAGAAGILAALFAARAGRTVVLVESTKDGGRKILISGGGRCNVLPAVAQPGRYVTESSSNLLRKILLSWPLREQVEFFEHELGQKLDLEEESGKLFPSSNRARDVRDGLLARVRAAGADIWFEARMTGLAAIAESDRVQRTARWRVELAQGPPVDAGAVILATGGLSVPATGSDGVGLSVVQALGHTVHDTYPALTPLTAQPPVHADLAGVSLEVTVRAPGTRPRFEATGGFLFTHRGYSGPVVLDASHLAVRSRMAGGRQELTVQWTAEDRETWEALLRGTQRVTGIPVSKGAIGTPAIQRSTGTFATAATVTALLRRRLPTRLADRLVQEAGVAPACPLSQLTKVGRTALVRLLTEYPLPWSGDEGYKKAEVTGGGVALSEVHPGSLESRLHPGLFLCGEILDAFGPIGGHNFLWAWATGRAAGLGAARSVLAESSDGI